MTLILGFTTVLTGVEWVHCLFLFPLVLGKLLVVTCKIRSFMCSLGNLLQKNIIVFFFFFFLNQISKWHPFEKRAIFDLLFIFFSYQEKVTKIPLAHISLTYIHVFCSFCSPYCIFFFFFFFFFFALPILKKTQIYQV